MAARPPACASGARSNPAASVESSQDRTGAGPGWVTSDPKSATWTSFLPDFLSHARALATNDRVWHASVMEMLACAERKPITRPGLSVGAHVSLSPDGG